MALIRLAPTHTAPHGKMEETTKRNVKFQPSRPCKWML